MRIQDSRRDPVTRQVARESGRPELNKLFDIPPEIEAIKREIENKAELAQDIIDGIDDADFVNIDTDKYYQKLRDELGDFSNPFNSENCDP